MVSHRPQLISRQNFRQWGRAASVTSAKTGVSPKSSMYNNGVTARVQIFAARHEFSHWIDLNNTAAHSAELSSYQCGLSFSAQQLSVRLVFQCSAAISAACLSVLSSYQCGLKVLCCDETGVVLKIMYVRQGLFRIFLRNTNPVTGLTARALRATIHSSVTLHHGRIQW